MSREAVVHLRRTATIALCGRRLGWWTLENEPGTRWFHKVTCVECKRINRKKGAKHVRAVSSGAG